MTWTGLFAVGDPSVEIGSPCDGSTSLTHTVNVTGAANGSDAQWSQSSGADFNAGTLDDVVVDPAGGVRLAKRVEDDFDDNSLDTSVWNVANQNGISASEEGKALHIRGTSTTSSYWLGTSWVTSSRSVSMFVQATLTSFSGTGSGYTTSLAMYQDGSNYVGIGEQHDQAWGSGIYLITMRNIAGTSVIEQWGSISSHPHTYKITYTGGVADLYQDGAKVTSVTVSLTSPKVLLSGGARVSGDSMDAKWDGVISEYTSGGTLTSSVWDTRSLDPVLVAVGWNSTTPDGTSLYIEVRSGPSSDMGSASAWTSVTNGQTSGLPVAMRFLQYRARFSTTDLMRTPGLQGLTVTYNKPVAKVELSVDEGATWTKAEGKEQWWALMDLPEGTAHIIARVTDVAGDINETRIRVEVDTTPPEGKALIGGDVPYTAVRNVTVMLEATDIYGVVQMKVGASEDLSDTLWRPFAPRMDWVLPPGDGVKTVYARFRDTNGLESSTVNDTIVLDTHAPIGTVAINEGARYSNSTAVRLALLATDLTGVPDVMVSERPDLSGAGWVPFSGTLDFMLSPQEGERTVYAAFRDPLGHVSATASASIVLDMTPPTLDLTIGGGAAYTAARPVQVTIAASEPSRIGSVQVGEDPSLLDAPKGPLDTPLQWVLSPGDGSKTLYARAWDLAGNGGPVSSASIVLDTTPPSVDITIDGGAAYTVSHLVTVELIATDANPIVTVELGEDPALSDAMPRPFMGQLNLVLSPGDGSKTVYALVIDAAGNVAPMAGASIVLDTSPPSLVLTVQAGATLVDHRDITVEVSASDASGVGQMQLGEDPALTGAPLTPFSDATTWTLSPGDGGKTIFGRVMDRSGNLGAIVSCSIVLDTTPPVSAMNPYKGISEATDIMLSWGGSDATAGVLLFDVQAQDDQGPWTDVLVRTNATRTVFKGLDGHSYAFRVRAQDAAGNQEAYPGLVPATVHIDVPEPNNALSTSQMVTVLVVVATVVSVVAGYLVMTMRRRPMP
jgi:hypothetical protein